MVFDQSILPQLVDKSPSIVFVRDFSGKMLFKNNRYIQYFENEDISEDVLYEKRLKDFPDSYEELVFKEKRSLNYEQEIFVGGKSRTFYTVKFPVKDENGEVVGIGCSATDITPMKRTSDALLRSEERYRAFIVNSEDGIIRYDLTEPVDTKLPVDVQVKLLAERSTVAECNPAMAYMLGWQSHADIMGKLLKDLNAHHSQVLEKTVSNNYRLSDFEDTLPLPDGTVKIISRSYQCILQENKVVRIWAVIRDITNKRKGEAAIRRIAELLSQHTGQYFFNTLTSQLLELLGADYVFVGEYKEAHHAIEVIAANNGDLQNPYSFAVSGTPFESLVGDWSFCAIDEKLFEKFPYLRLGDKPVQYESLISICLRSIKGRRMGVITVLFKNKRQKTNVVESLLRIFAARASSEMERQQHMKQLEYQARHDLLTGLLNRYSLNKKLNKLISKETDKFSLFLIDLNQFKDINDTLGHDVGDKILQQIGPRIQNCLPVDASLYRLGGDEFAVIVESIFSNDKCLDLAAKIIQQLKSPFSPEGTLFQIGASVGIAIYPEHGTTGSNLLKHADVAMYATKENMREALVYSPDIDKHSPMRLSLMSDVSRGLLEEQFHLVYQPKVCMKSNSLLGFEALIRWNHPRHGQLLPVEFIPLVELNEQIQPLTRWVIQNAMKQLMIWNEKGYNYTVSVNLSSRNLLDASLVLDIETMLQEFDIRAEQLEFEVTESSLMLDPDRAILILNQISDLGILISIDDYGTGYSSLSYLKKLPVRVLKIDKSFILGLDQDDQDEIIVKSTINLAHNMGLKVVGEGITNETINRMLIGMGCDIGQGYYISKPLEPSILEDWISTRSSVLSNHSDQVQFG